MTNCNQYLGTVIAYYGQVHKSSNSNMQRALAFLSQCLFLPQHPCVSGLSIEKQHRSMMPKNLLRKEKDKKKTFIHTTKFQQGHRARWGEGVYMFELGFRLRVEGSLLTSLKAHCILT